MVSTNRRKHDSYFAMIAAHIIRIAVFVAHIITRIMARTHPSTCTQSSQDTFFGTCTQRIDTTLFSGRSLIQLAGRNFTAVCTFLFFSYETTRGIAIVTSVMLRLLVNIDTVSDITSIGSFARFFLKMINVSVQYQYQFILSCSLCMHE